MPTGRAPHFLVFRVCSRYLQLLPGKEEVAVPTLAIVVGAPASGYKSCSSVATGGRSKPCIWWLWCSGRGQRASWRPGCLVVTCPSLTL